MLNATVGRRPPSLRKSRGLPQFYPDISLAPVPQSKREEGKQGKRYIDPLTITSTIVDQDGFPLFSVTSETNEGGPSLSDRATLLIIFMSQQHAAVVS